jgi:hypothetical protein
MKNLKAARSENELLTVQKMNWRIKIASSESEPLRMSESEPLSISRVGCASGDPPAQIAQRSARRPHARRRLSSSNAKNDARPKNGSLRSDARVANPIVIEKESSNEEVPDPEGAEMTARLSLGAAAKVAGVCVGTLRIAIKDGRLRAIRQEGRYSIGVDDLEQFRPARRMAVKSTDRLCEACGAPFESKRDDEIYCSLSCQKNGPRRRRRAAARAARAARLADLESRRACQ